MKYHITTENVKSEKKILTKEPTIAENSKVDNSVLGEYTEIGPNSTMLECSMGDYSYFARDVDAIWTDIGNFCSIASHCVINPGNHPTWRVTQNHSTYRRVQFGFADTDDSDFFKWRKEDRVTIGHDVWLGHGVTVLAGATIGNGAVVAAGSVVTKKNPIPPYAISVGTPAKPIKYRFTSEVISKLEKIQYWNWSREKLEKCFKDFNDVDTFISKYGE